jgi:hypothetical protein
MSNSVGSSACSHKLGHLTYELASISLTVRSKKAFCSDEILFMRSKAGSTGRNVACRWRCEMHKWVDAV